MGAPATGTEGGMVRRVGAVVLAGGLAAYLFAALAAEGGLSARAVLLRYAFVAAGVFAVAPPQVLLPDRAVRLVQLLNPPPRALLLRQLRPWGLVVGAFLVPPALLAAELGGAWAAFAETALLVLGVGLYAFGHYTAIGPVSQDWQEGRRGGWYRAMVARDPRASFQVPHGLVPSVLAAVRVFGLAAVAILAAAFLGDLGWLPGALLLGYAGLALARRAGSFDHDFYCTNALYAEALAQGGVRTAQRDPVAYEAVYWAPVRWRPHVWASLLQLDRRLPLGRLFALGVLGFWTLLVRDASPGVVAGALALGLAAKNGAVGLLANERLAPRAFDLWMQSAAGWTATRFFVNVRWTLPLALALGLAALFDDAFTRRDAAFWVGVDLALALLTAWLTTYAAEIRYRRRFA